MSNTKAMDYTVVQFTDEENKPVDAIPSCWLIDENFAWWPNYSNNLKTYSAIVDRREPDPATWIKTAIYFQTQIHQF